MPRLSLFAHCVRHPNGTTSDPFIASFRKSDMVRFAHRLLEDQWPEWKGCLHVDGRVDVPTMEAKRAADDFDSGSARIELAFDGAFFATLMEWGGGRSGCDRSGPRERPDGCLSYGELAVIRIEAGWGGGPWSVSNWGVDDPIRAIGLTTLKWAKQIEEWDVT